MLPKYIKEADADPMIEEIMSGGAASASGKKKESVIDFDTLKHQIETFLQYVDSGYYYEPNRVVPSYGSVSMKMDFRKEFSQGIRLKCDTGN